MIIRFPRTLAFALLALAGPAMLSAATWKVDVRRHRVLNREKSRIERKVRTVKQSETEVNFIMTKLPLVMSGANDAMPGAVREQLVEIARRFRTRDLAQALSGAVNAVDGFPGYSDKERRAIEHLRRVLEARDRFAKDMKARHDAICAELDAIIPPETVRRFRQEARKMMQVTRADRLLAGEIEKNEKRRLLETGSTRESRSSIRALDERIHAKREEMAVVELRRACGRLMLEALSDDVLDEAEQKALQEARQRLAHRSQSLMQVRQNTALSEVWRRAQGRPEDSVLAGMRMPAVATQAPAMSRRFEQRAAEAPATDYRVTVNRRGRNGQILPLQQGTAPLTR